MQLPHSDHEQNRTIPNRAIFELTCREWEVLIQVAEDLSNVEIADRLSLTPKSVENYRARIGKKLSLKGHRLVAQFARVHRKELRYWYQQVVGNPLPFNYR